MRELHCKILKKGFLRCWWLAIILGAILMISSTILAIIFPWLSDKVLDKEIVLREGTKSFGWWKKPPVTSQLRIYIYNVTNADGFLINGEKPALQELGPYVYLKNSEKRNVNFNKNGTVTYNLKQTFHFSKDFSRGYEEDFVIVPNVTMLSITTKLKDSESWVRELMADSFNSEPFMKVSVKDLLWGYEEPLLSMVSFTSPNPENFPDKFGLMYGKNGTEKGTYTMFTGATDASKYGLLDKWNGKDGLGHWSTPDCDSVMGSDGSIFPPHITKQTVLKVFQKDFCQLMPLVYEQDVLTARGVPAFRFVPPTKVFSSPNQDPSQRCFAASEPHDAPQGTFNVSLCQNGSPLLLSFPHFYQADPSLREAVTGMSPPEVEKHQTYIDVQPTLGTTLRSRARMQINLAVSHVEDIESVASFPDIVFPLMWFESGVDGFPNDVTSVIKKSLELPVIARFAIPSVLAAFGALLLIVALICLSCLNQKGKFYINNTPPDNFTKNIDKLTSDRRNPSVMIDTAKF